MDPIQFEQFLSIHHISLSAVQQQQFEQYFETLVDWNEKINLTAITNKKEVYEKHFYDSISPAFFFDFSKVNTLIDIGAGAGFPSLPIKVMYPHIKVTIVDSLNKRIQFLQHLVQQLNLKDVVSVHGRAEELGLNPKYREQYDAVTARAVARLSVLNEYCLPFVKIDGHFIVLKGANALNELSEGKKAMDVLGGETEEVTQFQLPSEQAERSIIVIKKVKPTPKKYPRKAGTPSKNPIQ